MVVVIWILSSPDASSSSLELVNIFMCRKRLFVQVIKMRTLGWEGTYELCRWAQTAFTIHLNLEIFKSAFWHSYNSELNCMHCVIISLPNEKKTKTELPLNFCMNRAPAFWHVGVSCLECWHPIWAQVWVLASPFPIQLSADAAEKAVTDGQGHGTLPSMWETYMGLLDSGFSLAQP